MTTERVNFLCSIIEMDMGKKMRNVTIESIFIWCDYKERDYRERSTVVEHKDFPLSIIPSVYNPDFVKICIVPKGCNYRQGLTVVLLEVQSALTIRMWSGLTIAMEIFKKCSCGQRNYLVFWKSF